jgi:hypothetical protein
MPDGINLATGITAPGIYNIEHERYHSDPIAVPSLSCSIARMLVRKTPRHAWQAHARFGSVGIIPSRVMDDGSAVHAMFSGQGHLIETLKTTHGAKTKKRHLIGMPVTAYTTDAAKEERDEIREQGKIPVLSHRLPELLRCYEAALEQLKIADDGAVFLSPGRSEVMGVSQEDDVWLRVLVDRLPNDGALPPGDLKCTEMSAAPGDWERRLQTEYAFQCAFYRRVLRGAEGFDRPPMRFGVIELEPPHGTVINAAAPDLQAIAEEEVERAVQRWRHCMRTGVWPLYPRYTAWVGAKPWQIAEAAEAAFREEQINEIAA